MSLSERRPEQYPLAALRIVSGLLFLGYGLVKVAGFPDGASPGQQPVLSLFWIGGLIEIISGILITLGLLTRPAALIASGQMAVAYWFFHAPDAFVPAANGGSEAILFCFTFLYFALGGGGPFSTDSAIARRRKRPA